MPGTLDPLNRVVPLTASMRKRLYEPVIMLYCLIMAYVEGRTIEAPGTQSETSMPKTRAQTFYCFVDKLGHICDSRKGGKTVTAFAILQTGRIEYRFTSNRRTANELAAVRHYITGILTSLGDATAGEIKDALKRRRSPFFTQILGKIVRFNRPRVEYYARTVRTQLGFCADEVELDNSEEAQGIITHIEALEPLVEAIAPRQVEVEGDSDTYDDEYEFEASQLANTSEMTDDDFVSHAEDLVMAIDGCYRDSFEDFVRAKCETSGENDGHWRDLHHALCRLQSYFVDVTVLASACKHWPQLFANFTVVAVPSGSQDRRPPEIRKTAGKMLVRMTTDTEIINTFRRNEAQLKAWGLDTRIKEIAESDSFKPCVHAEVQLHGNISREERNREERGDEPLRVFGEGEFGRYIGSSKPTCRLCSLYFAPSPGGWRARPSSNNFYHTWRAPDIYVRDGRKAELQRNAMIERIIETVREETFAAIRTRSETHRPHDSNDTPSSVPLPRNTDGSSSVAARGDDLVSRMSGLLLQTIRESSPGSLPQEVTAFTISTPKTEAVNGATPANGTPTPKTRLKDRAQDYLDAQFGSAPTTRQQHASGDDDGDEDGGAAL